MPDEILKYKVEKVMITCKAGEIGINIILEEKSHTSKCSFLDNEKQ